MAKFRKIGVLTSGGDAPGMNATLKAVVDKACSMGIEVIGIEGGYSGLLNGDLIPLKMNDVSNIVGRGGTMLYSSRCLEFKTEAGILKAVKTCRDNQIDALVCIGGDGTFRGAVDMTRHGIPSIGIPGTIDNDITATDYTVGFDTSINTTVAVIDNLRDTCESHSRLNVVEVMGRHCGQITLYSAIASGSVAFVIQEVPFDEDAAMERIRSLRASGKRGMTVVVAEGVKNPDGTPFSESLAERITEKTGVETKFMRLAHLVRGGDPTMRDRVIASEMGIKAVELLVEGKSNLEMCVRNGKVVSIDIEFALMADMMYKNKLKPGDLDPFSSEQIAEMESLCEERREELRNLCAIANDVAL